MQELAKSELHKLMQEIELQFSSLCILGNKQDVESAVDVSELAKILDVKSISNKCAVMPAVAKTGEGLDEAMTWLSQNITPL